MKKSVIALTILASLLTGCASDAEKMAQDQLALEQARRDGAAEARAQLTAQMEEEMAEVVPSWYLDPPKMDGTGVYGVGTAHTKIWASPCARPSSSQSMKPPRCSRWRCPVKSVP